VCAAAFCDTCLHACMPLPCACGDGVNPGGGQVGCQLEKRLIRAPDLMLVHAPLPVLALSQTFAGCMPGWLGWLFGGFSPPTC
jgi:hypothetical protein